VGIARSGHVFDLVLIHGISYVSGVGKDLGSLVGDSIARVHGYLDLFVVLPSCDSLRKIVIFKVARRIWVLDVFVAVPHTSHLSIMEF
jgi:hypothetical protein